MSPKYNTVFSIVSSASCSNDSVTSTSNCVSTNISTSSNTVTCTRISVGNLALATTLISEPIYTISSSWSKPHSLCSSVGIKTWAQNLITPHINPSSQTFNFSTPSNNNQSPPVNLNLPSFWEKDIELWLAAVEHQFILSNIFTEQRRFSAMLDTLDYNVIRRVQNIIRNPGNQTYHSLKKALIELYKISDNDRFDHLLHRIDLGDRKPSELLSEFRKLLGESYSENTYPSKLLTKLFLDKLPPQVRLILAGSPRPTLKLRAQRADDIMLTMSSALSLNSNAA